MDMPPPEGGEKIQRMTPQEQANLRLNQARQYMQKNSSIGRLFSIIQQWFTGHWGFSKTGPAQTARPGFSKIRQPQFAMMTQEPTAPAPMTTSKLDVRTQPVPQTRVIFPKTQTESAEKVLTLKDHIDRMFAALKAYTGNAPNTDPAVRKAVDAYTTAFTQSDYNAKMRKADAENGTASAEMIALAQKGDMEGLRKANTEYSRQLHARSGFGGDESVVLNDAQLVQLRDSLLREAARTPVALSPLARFTKLLDIDGNAPGYRLTVTKEGTIEVTRKGQEAPEVEPEPKDLAESIVRLVAVLKAYKGSDPNADPAVRKAVQAYVDFFKRSPAYEYSVFYRNTKEAWLKEAKPLALVNDREGFHALNRKYHKILNDYRAQPADPDNHYLDIRLPDNSPNAIGYVLSATPVWKTPLQSYTAKLAIGQFAPGYELIVSDTDAVTVRKR